MNMKHWKAKSGAIFLIGGDERILSIELRKDKVRFSEECDVAYWVEKPADEAIETLQEAIDYLRANSKQDDHE